MLRLQQVTSGFLAENIIDPESGEIEDTTYHDIGTEKADLLREVLEGFDADEPVVIACRFRHDIDIIRAVCAGLGRRVYEQSGRRKERVAWQEARGGEVLIGQIRSVCEAISLVRSRYAILYSLGHSLYQYVQFLGRLDRPGQTRQPCYIHLLAQRTIDEAIYRAFRRNQNFIDTINTVVRAGGRSLNTSLNTLLSGAAA